MEKINTMNYLFAAYIAIWIILALYLYSIHSREQSLREEVRRLRDLLEKKSREYAVGRNCLLLTADCFAESPGIVRTLSDIDRRGPLI